MADVIDLASRRPRPKVDVLTIVDVSTASISSYWEHFAKLNKLSDFIVDSIGVWAKEGAAYLSDLNAVAALESQLGMKIVIRSPLDDGHLGWRVTFAVPGLSDVAETPELPFETYARCFAVLLFIKLRRELTVAGVTGD